MIVKIASLVGLRSLVNLIKTNVTRWIIKNKFSSGELSFTRWYTTDFLMNLGLTRLMYLGIIASFTAVLFPIGIQLSSYKLSDSFPIMRIISGLVSFVIMPLSFYTAHASLNEMPITRITLTGLVLVEIGSLAIALGGWVMYRGVKLV